MVYFEVIWCVWLIFCRKVSILVLMDGVLRGQGQPAHQPLICLVSILVLMDGVLRDLRSDGGA